MRIASGQAWVQGEAVAGSWTLPVSGLPSGWSAISLTREGCNVARTMPALALPLWWIESEGDAVLCARDIRRWCDWWQWEAGIANSDMWLDWSPPVDAVVRKAQGLALVDDGDLTFWVGATCTLPVARGQVITEPIAAPLRIGKTAHRATGLVVEWSEA